MAAAIGLAGDAATAEAGSSLCPANMVCTYVDKNFSGLMGYRAGGGGLLNVTSLNDNKMSSWENRSSSNAAWYYGLNGTGKCLNMLAGYEFHYVQDVDNDQMSSWKTNGKCP